MPGKTILIVEDNAIVALALQRTLIRLGYSVLEPVDTGEGAIVAAAAQRPDLVVMDVALAGSMDGVIAAEQIQVNTPIPVVYLTGNPHDARLKHTFCLSKPVVESDLARMLEKALRKGD